MSFTKTVTDIVRSVSIVTKQSQKDNLLSVMLTWVSLISGQLRKNEVLQMYHPHINAKTVVQCMNNVDRAKCSRLSTCMFETIEETGEPIGQP